MIKAIICCLGVLIIYTMFYGLNEINTKLENIIINQQSHIEELNHQIEDIQNNINMLELQNEEFKIELGTISLKKQEENNAYYIKFCETMPRWENNNQLVANNNWHGVQTRDCKNCSPYNINFP